MIELLDVSHWQSINDWKKLAAAGIKGVYIKFTQGTSFTDIRALEHYENAKSVGLKVGAYHFTTKANGIEQYDWFNYHISKCKFELRPMLDCEAYNSYVSFYDKDYAPLYYEIIQEELEVFPVLELRYGNINQEEVMKMADILGYTYPTEAIVDVIGRRLAGFQGFDLPSIYTNPSSGNAIFKSTSMKKYPLHVAHWGVSKPTLPKVWKGEKYYMWQNAVVDGEKYGVISGRVDHNYWGEKVAFPEDVINPPVPEEEIFVTAYPNNVKYQGTLKKG